MHRFNGRKSGVNSSRNDVDTHSETTRHSVSPIPTREIDSSIKLPIEPVSPVSEVSKPQSITLHPTESSDDLYGLTPVQTKQAISQLEHEKPQVAFDLKKKRSLTSVKTVKKLALRLGLPRIGSRDGKVNKSGNVLRKRVVSDRSEIDISPYSLYLSSSSSTISEERSSVSASQPQPAGTFRAEDVSTNPTSSDASEKITDRPSSEILDLSDAMPKTKVKPLPAAPQAQSQAPPDFGLPPEFGASADHNLARLLPEIRTSNNFANSIDEKLTSLKLDRPPSTMRDELEATQQKLTQLFESQALLRERYNTEKDRSSKLDAEHQNTHSRIHSLEQSARDMNDELRRLYEYVGSLERANQELRGGARTTNSGAMHAAQDTQSAASVRASTASPPISEIQPLRPHPPPIPEKAERRSLLHYDGSPISRENSNGSKELPNAPQSANEDISYW